MSDLTIEVIADDLTEHVFSLLQEKDEQFRVQSGGNQEEYERYFKKWLNECFCEFGSKCEDFGYYQAGGRDGISNEHHSAILDEIEDAIYGMCQDCHDATLWTDRKYAKIRRIKSETFLSLLKEQIKSILEKGRGWKRTEFCSIWADSDIELIVVQSNGSSESWQWTARGWREPGDAEGADNWGWCEVSTRSGAEESALRFYMEKDE